MENKPDEARLLEALEQSGAYSMPCVGVLTQAVRYYRERVRELEDRLAYRESHNGMEEKNHQLLLRAEQAEARVKELENEPCKYGHLQKQAEEREAALKVELWKHEQMVKDLNQILGVVGESARKNYELAESLKKYCSHPAQEGSAGEK